MSKNEWKILGLKELTRDLKNLPILKQASILRNANRKAAKLKIEKPLIAGVPFKARLGIRSKKRAFSRDRKKQVVTVNEKGS